MAWITRTEALARLGVKAQTLYAYVSRGAIAARADEKAPRRSLYAAADVEKVLRRQRSRGRRQDIAAGAISWGDPVMATRIATVREGRLIYAGEDAVAFAQSATLEACAELLFGAPLAPLKPGDRPHPPTDKTAKARGFTFLSSRAASDAPSFGRSRKDLAAEAIALYGGLIDALNGRASAGPLHERLARGWSLKPGATDLLRMALVLVADHELNPSTFAARIAASTGASLAAAALAGYATLTGPLHGEASRRALTYLQRAEDAGADTAIAELLASGHAIPAMGHLLYPKGDPRAALLLSRLKLRPSLAAAIAAAEAKSGENANIDMALAALTIQLKLPADAPFVIFAAGRMTGWMAHAIEQREKGRPIRPRATYEGPLP